MGNRAIITLEGYKGERHPVAVYLHWHGGLESVLAFMEYTWEIFPRGRDDVFTFHARLCQVIGNFFADGLSLYGHPLEDVAGIADGCDNGHFHVVVGPKGVRFPGKEAACAAAREHDYWTREHSIQKMMARAMPTRDAEFSVHGGTAPPGVEAVGGSTDGPLRTSEGVALVPVPPAVTSEEMG